MVGHLCRRRCRPSGALARKRSGDAGRVSGVFEAGKTDESRLDGAIIVLFSLSLSRTAHCRVMTCPRLPTITSKKS
jgi:hypothetical protein